MKKIFCIRHGEAQHNLDWFDFGEAAYFMKGKTDPKLTIKGNKQSLNFKEIDKVELIITSPLTRCLETTINIFGNVKVPIYASENAREFPMGLQYVNKRSKKSALENRFKKIDFSNLKSEEDLLWNNERLENLEELNNRTKKLMDFIVKRPEKNIALVSHSSFLMKFLYDKVDENHEKELIHCHPYLKIIEGTDFEKHKESSSVYSTY
tara:strand:- start:28 stop:651 length:624 start_codon:yes stop_codon:yes gene_type:complete